MKRGGPLRRSTPIAKVSAKRRRLNRDRAKFVADVLARRTVCEGGHRIVTVDDRHRCDGRPVDVHEVVTRARGGSIVDESNVIALCRACHDWIHTHPLAATTVGLLASKYPT